MARADVKFVDSGGRGVHPVRTFKTNGGDANILAGEPVKLHVTAAGAGTELAGAYYPVPLADGETVQGFYFLGIAAKDSTHSSTADGTVDVYLDLPGTIYSIKPKTANKANTDRKIGEYQFYRMVIDLTSSNYRIDDGTTDVAANPFTVVGGNADEDRLHFVANESATWRNWGKYSN